MALFPAPSSFLFLDTVALGSSCGPDAVAADNRAERRVDMLVVEKLQTLRNSAILIKKMGQMHKAAGSHRDVTRLTVARLLTTVPGEKT